MHLPIFPENGLANSVIPPVLAGLTFSTFFAEFLGWNFSGLIVPGYLAPIFIVKPFSAVVIVVEALITYMILRLLSDGFSRVGFWTRFFGQDAFFALLCISILVKCVLEGPLQPFIGNMLSQLVPGTVDFRNELHSMGLIVVPLLANIFWRHGIRKNLLPASTVILLTYLFVSHILIPYTNFSVNKFELMYSNMAINFEESARFYVILLLGAGMAAHNKYRFGWAYHGMLIPALLGIAWLTPLKIMTTFIEAGLILGIAIILVKSKFMQNITLEGPRKLLMLFTIGFCLKMAAGFLLQGTTPGFQALDIYGFAYILPALLAMEMWPGRDFVKIVRVTTQTSLIAAVTGVLICSLLAIVSPESFASSKKDQENTEILLQDKYAVFPRINDSLTPWLDNELKSRMAWGADYEPMQLQDMYRLDNRLLKPLVQSFNNGNELNESQAIKEILLRSGMKLVTLIDNDQTYRILLSESASSYRGMYIFRTGQAEQIAIQVPQPKSELCTLELGRQLFQDLNARALLISGVSRRHGVAEFDVTHLQTRKNLFQLTHQVLHRESVESNPMLSIQIRGASAFADPDLDILLSTGREIRGIPAESDRLIKLEQHLESWGINLDWYSGMHDDINYSTRSIAQQAYVDTFSMGEFVVAWASKRYRISLKTPDLPERILEQLKITYESGELDKFVNCTVDKMETALSTHNSELFRTQISHELYDYSITGNILHVQRIEMFASQSDYQLVDFHDSKLKTRFLIAIPFPESEQPLFVFNYLVLKDTPLIANSHDKNMSSIIRQFYLARHESLAVTGE